MNGLTFLNPESGYGLSSVCSGDGLRLLSGLVLLVVSDQDVTEFTPAYRLSNRVDSTSKTLDLCSL